MSSILIDDVKKLARLSAIDISDQEAADLTNDLENILGYVELLNQVDTDNTNPTYQVVNLENVYRSDKIAHPVEQADLLANVAEKNDDGSIVVPKVL